MTDAERIEADLRSACILAGLDVTTDIRGRTVRAGVWLYDEDGKGRWWLLAHLHTAPGDREWVTLIDRERFDDILAEGGPYTGRGWRDRMVADVLRALPEAVAETRREWGAESEGVPHGA